MRFLLGGKVARKKLSNSHPLIVLSVFGLLFVCLQICMYAGE